jgi:hydrogenase expression/formation protein HypE
MENKNDKQSGRITLAHGSGGLDSAALMERVFAPSFSNSILARLEDGAVLPADAKNIVVSTDSFVVTPVEFPGGDIGKLAVCGSVNDVLMMGAVPKWLTCGYVLEEGLEIEKLERVARSMAKAAAEAGVTIVAGDTKVIGRCRSDEEPGLTIATTGIGFSRKTVDDGLILPPGADRASDGDAVILSGTLGDHHACILSARMHVENDIRSDCAVLAAIPDALYEAGIDVHVMRDVTRGGLATVTNEIASSSGACIVLDEDAIPVRNSVRAFCGIMGLEPVMMGNEGKMIAIVSAEDAQEALACIKNTAVGRDARIIGHVQREDAPSVLIKTKIGGTRRLGMLRGEGLPRIC